MNALAQSDTLHVFFDVDVWELDPSQKQTLEQFARLQHKVTAVHAYCDSSGSLTYNDRLSQRRLNSVLGIIGQSKSGNYVGHGERKSNFHGVNMGNFRRVDVVYEKEVALVEEVKAEEVPNVAESDIVPLPEPSEISRFLEGEEEEVTIQLTILFYNVSGQYLPESEPELRALLSFMTDHPEVRAHIRGHICCNPYTEWDEISQARAATVAFYLVDRGIARDRITFKGYGTSIPFRSPEITDEDKKLNRRVDVVFTKHQE